MHAVIGKIFKQFALLATGDWRWEEREKSYQAIEWLMRWLYVLGAFGLLVQGAEGLELRLSREALDPALKRHGCKDPLKAIGVLAAVGFKVSLYGADAQPSPAGYKQSAAVGLRYPPANDGLLQALIYYAKRLPEKKAGRKEKGIIFEVFLRADLRPLLPGYSYHIPHLPATEDEVTLTLKPATLEVWRALTGYMAGHNPQYHLYYRVTGPCNRRWVSDYSLKDND